MSSIVFGGLKVRNNINYIVFVNSENVNVEIPIEKVSADRIEKYLCRICPSSEYKTKEETEDLCHICLKQIGSEEDITITTKTIDGKRKEIVTHYLCEEGETKR